MANIILLNKPFNVLCQFTDREGRATLAEHIAKSGIYPAGRLDYDSEGLVVLTDDGHIQHQISSPGFRCNKTYWVQVEGNPDSSALEPLRQGIKLNDGICRPARVKSIDEPEIWPRDPPIRDRKNQPTSWIEITISEGRNRQVRRMTAAIGFPTLRLIRIKVGSWSINDLKPGEMKTLTIHAPNLATRRHTPKPRRRL
ncbi:MAG: pseudouridine synthase [Pseudomonadales bacterium]